MGNFNDACGNIVNEVQNLLYKSRNNEWIKRYADYAGFISANLETIKNKKKQFNEWAPLYLYMNIGSAKDRMPFSLRYLGQEVATLKVGQKYITISTKNFDSANERDFNCKVQLHNKEWASGEASNFRRYFSGNPERTDKSRKRNEEHRIESLLLTEFSKTKKKHKFLHNVQPVKFAGVARFQMSTPLKASNIKNVAYSGSNGGGIDILSRIGIGNATKLCIMEVKDENIDKEPPTHAILQALAYATFIRELLRSESGQLWWQIFGFNGELPGQLNIPVVCVMPSTQGNDFSFQDETIAIDNDLFSLNYLYFTEKNNTIVDGVTSLKQCNVKTRD
jgi:hypothetical protein